MLLEDWGKKKKFGQEHHEKILHKTSLTLIRNIKSQKKSYIGVPKIAVQFLSMTLKLESGVQ